MTRSNGNIEPRFDAEVTVAHRKCSSEGTHKAQYNLEQMRHRGKGMPPDFKKSAHATERQSSEIMQMRNVNRPDARQG